MLIELHCLILAGKKTSSKASELIDQLKSIETLINEQQQLLYFFFMSILADSIDEKIQFLTSAIAISPFARLYYELAMKHIGLSAYSDALVAANKALSRSMDEGNFRGILFTNNLIGEIFYLMKDYSRAEIIYARNIRLLQSSGSQNKFILGFYFFSYLNMANLAYYQNNYSKMLTCCRFAGDHEDAGDGRVYGILHTLLLSEYYFQQGDKEHARQMLDAASAKKEKSFTSDKSFELALLDLSEYRMTSDNYIKDDIYLEKLREMKTIILRDGLFHYLRFIERYLVEYYIANKKYKEAYLIQDAALNTSHTQKIPQKSRFAPVY